MHSHDLRDLHGLFSSQGAIFSGSPLSPGMLAWPSSVANLDGSGHYPALAADPPVDLTVVGQGISIPPASLINASLAPASGGAGGRKGGGFPGTG